MMQHPAHAQIGVNVVAVGVGDDDPVRGVLEERAVTQLARASRFLRPLASGVVRTDQQVSDNFFLSIAQCRDRHNRGKPAAVFTEVRQLIDILDTA